MLRPARTALSPSSIALSPFLGDLFLFLPPSPLPPPASCAPSLPAQALSIYLDRQTRFLTWLAAVMESMATLPRDQKARPMRTWCPLPPLFRSRAPSLLLLPFV